jgi:catechol-2,3-dioxygenase
MPVHRLNHVVLYVRDCVVTRTFYEEVLGFREVMGVAGKASFLQAPGSTNDHDLGLFSIGDDAGNTTAGRSTVGMYHVAWEVSTLNELADIRDELTRRGHLVGASDHSTTKALYAVDPDGLEFEVSWIVPATLLSEEILRDRIGVRPLHLEREIERFGGSTVGGLGISVPLDVHA